jgi:MFS family permease
LPAILYGLTAWSIPGLAASCCGDISDAKRAPAVLGLITFVFGFGQVLGPIIAGYVKEHTSSFTGAFLLAAVLAALGAFFSSRLIITKGVRK